MLKKLTTVLLLALPITAMAAWGQGPYLGIGIGADTVDFKQTAFVTRTGDSLISGAFQVKDDEQHAAQGVMGTVFGGYSWNCGMLYLAGELNGDLSSAQFQSTNTNYTANNSSGLTYKINRSWGASALPGIMLPWYALAYGRVGYEGGSFHINSGEITLPSTDKTLSGLRLGVGLEKQFYKNFSMRIEYNHIQYQGFTDTGFDTSDAIGGHIVIKKTTINPYTNQVILGFTYRFC